MTQAIVSFETCISYVQRQLIRNFKEYHLSIQEKKCQSYIIGKHVRCSFPSLPTYQPLQPLELVYGSIFGPIVPTFGGNT